MSNPQDEDDDIVRYLKELGLPVTREAYIRVNWLGHPPEPWTEEHEQELPPSLRQSPASISDQDGSRIPPPKS
jgi:hypothetical protein